MQGQGLRAVADRQSGWIEALPARLAAFAVLARWDRPIGTWLLLWPCWWSAFLAPGWPSPVVIALFGIGAIAMRGAGCTVNDMADRRFDAAVERTRHRPLASGTLRMRDAVAFLFAQLAVGLAVLLALAAYGGAMVLVTGFASVPLIVAYPFMKRITWWPQAFLGITFSWGALMGWVVATGELVPPAWLLYAAGIAWTLGYDTVYAHQDKADDLLVGVRSSALRLGNATPAALWAFYAATVALLAAAGAAAGMGSMFYLGLIAVTGALARQVVGIRLDDPADCLRRFRANRGVGLLVLLAVVAGKLWP